MNRTFTQVFFSVSLVLSFIFGISLHNAHASSKTGDPIIDITVAIKAANTADILKYVGASIDINICSAEETCTKTSAEKALRDFFAQNPPQNFTIKHQGASKDGGKYAVGILNAGGKNYRVNIMLKQAGADMQLKTLEITKE